MHASQMSGTAERALPDPLLPQLCPRLPRDRLVAAGAGRPAQIRDREPRHAVASCSRVMQSCHAVAIGRACAGATAHASHSRIRRVHWFLLRNDISPPTFAALSLCNP